MISFDDDDGVADLEEHCVTTTEEAEGGQDFQSWNKLLLTIDP